jgi:hypothetical protein
MINLTRRPSPLARQLGFSFGLLLLVALLVPALSLAGPSAAPAVRGDLGDAPDSSNHFGVGMTAYPGIKAFFPTVFDPATGLPQGPLHLNVKKDSWLGRDISAEYDADQLPDADGITNIAPPANSPNRDRYDDGVFTLSPTIALPQCQPTQFRYIVTGAPLIPAHSAYVNVWFDFNRDGDWADKIQCQTSAGVFTVYEWAVQNQVVAVVPGSVVKSTPLFRSFHNSTIPMSWMRITMSETKAPLAPTGLADGRGPANGFKTGETEDYLLKLCTSCPAGTYSGS